MDLPLRHALATLAYRLGKVLRDTPAGFRDFEAAPSVRTPGQILAHIGDLLDWALSQVEGRPHWRDSEARDWEQEIARFFAALEALDQRVAARGLGAASAQKLFQSAVADAFTHTGQLALLRRMAGIPVRPENYAAADIGQGRVGPEQSPAASGIRLTPQRNGRFHPQQPRTLDGSFHQAGSQHITQHLIEFP
ncbi:MAG: hypothetical protein M3O20_01845 [Acidobacteriota bacterium]|nr:hypothetical protein [Acidobacteriota bacterium]